MSLGDGSGGSTGPDYDLVMRRALLVWNGLSGPREEARRDRIVELLGVTLELETHELGEGESGQGIAEAAIARGVEIVIAAGGDGTVSACASAMIGTVAALGIVACGTSNSIARALGLPTDLDAACEVITTGTTRRIDIARVNGRPMVLLASLGFHAETIETTSSDAKSTLGKLAYVLRGIERLAEFESFDVRIETERGNFELRAMALTVANFAPPDTIFAQGAAELLPDDGWLDLTVVAAETALEAVAAGIDLATSAITGTEAQGAHVGTTRCTRARITTEPPQRVLVDGDMIGTTPIDVEIVPLGLSIRSPAILGPRAS